MQNIISRVCFCARCAEAKRPTIEDWMLLYGRTQEQFFFTNVSKNVHVNKRGFVPHIFINDGWVSHEYNVMKVRHFCGIIDCGVIVTKVDGVNVDWHAKHVATSYLSAQEWNAIVLFTDTGYEL